MREHAQFTAFSDIQVGAPVPAEGLAGRTGRKDGGKGLGGRTGQSRRGPAIPYPHATTARRRCHAQPVPRAGESRAPARPAPARGPERKRFMDQARTDYMDYAMIGDATAELDNGILTLTIDLRPRPAEGTEPGS